MGRESLGGRVVEFNHFDIGSFLALAITMITLIIKQWSSDSKMLRMMEAVEKRQVVFQQTLDAINKFLQEASREHAVMLDRINRDTK